eukprot:1143267-Pelagomonas_calceolata.AAC.2
MELQTQALLGRRGALTCRRPDTLPPDTQPPDTQPPDTQPVLCAHCGSSCTCTLTFTRLGRCYQKISSHKSRESQSCKTTLAPSYAVHSHSNGNEPAITHWHCKAFRPPFCTALHLHAPHQRSKAAHASSKVQVQPLTQQYIAPGKGMSACDIVLSLPVKWHIEGTVNIPHIA